MHTLIIKNGVAVYEGTDKKLTADGVMSNDFRDTTTTTANAHTVTVPQLPDYFMPGKWGWDGEKLSILPAFESDILEQARADALAELANAFSAAEASGKVMSSAGFVIDATERSNRDIEGLISSMEATSTQETTFCAADNSFHTVTLDQLRAMRLEVIGYGQALYTRKWTLRTAIETAQSVEAVQAVDINFDGVSA